MVMAIKHTLFHYNLPCTVLFPLVENQGNSQSPQSPIMCFKDNEHFWFHITKTEFVEVFGIEIRTNRILYS